MSDSSTSDVCISVRGLAKSFGTQRVLEEVAFEIPRGRTFALLGRNGAGKTTTIRILLGLTSAERGAVSVAGCDPAREPLELRRRIGYLAEDQQMYGWMTPIELCRFLAPFYPTWDQRLAADYLDRFELPRQTRIDRLSKGQSVKLGLAAALAHRPQVAILDDPAIGLDPIARKEFNRDLVEHLQAEGRTVLYSSHLLDEVEAVADEVAILDRGRIIRHDATDALRDAVKRFVLSAEAAAGISAPTGLLDVRRHGERIAATVDGASDWRRRLDAEGIDYDAVDLSLDEIFEALVIGRREAWPRSGMAAAVA